MPVFIVHINQYSRFRAEIEVLYINQDGSTTRRKMIVPAIFTNPEVKARIVADKLITQWQRKLKVNNPLVTYIVEG